MAIPEKHKIADKRGWCKLHIAVDTDHYIQGAKLTDRFVSDHTVAPKLKDQLGADVNHITTDGACDNKFMYESFSKNYPNAQIIIRASSGTMGDPKNHKIRNQHVLMT